MSLIYAVIFKLSTYALSWKSLWKILLTDRHGEYYYRMDRPFDFLTVSKYIRFPDYDIIRMFTLYITAYLLYLVAYPATTVLNPPLFL